MVRVKTFGHSVAGDLLGPGERLVTRVGQHWGRLLWLLVETFGIIMAALVLGGVADVAWLVQSLVWYAAAVAVLRLVWEVLEWWTEILIVTEKRLIVGSGFIARRHSSIPIREVTNLSVRSSAVGKLLGYGTLRVKSANQNHELKTFRYLPRTEEVISAMAALAFRGGTGDLASHGDG